MRFTGEPCTLRDFAISVSDGTFEGVNINMSFNNKPIQIRISLKGVLYEY